MPQHSFRANPLPEVAPSYIASLDQAPFRGLPIAPASAVGDHSNAVQKGDLWLNANELARHTDPQ